MQMVRLLFAFVLLPTLTLSQTAEQTTAPARAVISGIVTDASTGQPLKKASIMFRNSQSGGGRFQQPLVVTTGSDGRFAMALEPGEYRLTANRNGYVRQAYGAKDPRQPGSPLTLAAGQELKDINFRLVPGGVIIEWYLNLSTVAGWLLSSVFLLSFARLARNT